MRRACLLAFVTAAILALSASSADTLDVYFINVGHGDAILIDHNDWEILLDTGYGGYWTEDSYCTALLDKRVSKPIEVFILSHPDRDHYNGFDFVYGRYGVVSVWHSPDPADDESGQAFLKAVDSKACTRVLSWTKAATPIWTGPLRWDILHPEADVEDEDDDASLVLKLTYGTTVFLFTGDIHASGSRSGQSQLIARFPGGVTQQEQIVYLKLPHHGSSNHIDPEFLRWTLADFAICTSETDCAEALEVLSLLEISCYPTLNTNAIHVHQAGIDEAPLIEALVADDP